MKKFLFTDNWRIFALVDFLLIALVATVSFFIFGKLDSSLSDQAQEVRQEVRELEPVEVPAQAQDFKQLGVLLLGYGGAGHQGGYLTDVIQLVLFDFEKQQIAMISIPRDLWVILPNGTKGKINQAFTLGSNPNQMVESGGEVSKQMAQLVTGLPVHYFAAIDFVGFQRAIGNTLDGIVVDVPERMEDPWYPIKGEELNPCGMSPEEVAQVTAQYSGFELEKQFECRYEHLSFESGPTQMEGGDALKYVRSRHGSAAGDFSRSQRQHAVLKGVAGKMISLDALADLPEFFTQVQSHITTDLDFEAVKFLSPLLTNAAMFEVQSIILSTDNTLVSGRSANGQSVLQPRAGESQFSQVQRFIQTQLDRAD